jgi:hypothetical protein
MKERPILWSAPMVLALLAGRKTQTRRIIKLNRPLHGDHYLQAMWGRSPPPDPVDFGTPGLFREVGPDYPDDASDDLMCPFVPGDRLWGREAWKTSADHDHRPPRDVPRDAWINWLANGQSTGGWRPEVGRYRHARFMMRWMSRLLHEVTDVRAEQLRSITDDDARAEGLERRQGSPNWFWPGGVEGFGSPRDCYLRGWDTINGKGAAAANPWVWAVTFRDLRTSG